MVHNGVRRSKVKNAVALLRIRKALQQIDLSGFKRLPLFFHTPSRKSTFMPMTSAMARVSSTLNLGRLSILIEKFIGRIIAVAADDNHCFGFDVGVCSNDRRNEKCDKDQRIPRHRQKTA